MKCVSYVRKTSFDPTDKNPNDMDTQMEHISAYVKERGWRLSRRYSDSTDDPKESAGCMKMKRAALRREFDCVIVDSVMRFGSDVYQTIRFLKNTFYPAGLHFAVVEDGFCSLDHTDEEVFAYIDEKRAFVRGRMVVMYTKEAAVESYFSSYGFLYNRQEHIVEIDKPSAEIITEVYTRLKEGETPSSIARDMTKRGVETPGHYYNRQRGWSQKRTKPSWTAGSVRSITKNPKYMGKWDCKYDVTKLDIRCGAIVEPELYEAVQQAYASRFDHVSGKKTPTPFFNLIWDKETGEKLGYCTRRGKSDIRFKEPDGQRCRYKKARMSCDEFHDKVARQLIREKKAAERALNTIRSNTGRKRKEAEMQTMRNRFGSILTEMTVLENEKMDEYRRFQNGEIQSEEYLRQENVIAGKLRTLDRQVEGLTLELDEIEQAYSDRNPWISLFAGFKEDDVKVRKTVSRLVEKILVCRFESVELVLKELKWKQALPEEWIREGDHGEKEQKE